ncbi:hypothetical protein TPHA_0A02170 [Tetrapisispora phaffii CBS 4417]|uniref:Histidinol-phosphatase n=1 Tax=Tetrapisispora phaffii (strain ATCC 24235 / CBS 4417 / NBRC 1672 / NRRL Y-8282 / UCD 70-5) TaxID=1071381 RepID=G8BN21_TETPH|nr:hypothetical protein TPHA_0A02170 [Tetrapisispora phaffii CBS 4417]CCE61299.1 hypothetical protein TPHA_0A02170 [Tetrapisispora phaffii CBS 4417]
MYSHHSHSGDYVAHGLDCLDDIVAEALILDFKTYCLTEHMPRITDELLYPEEFCFTNLDKKQSILTSDEALIRLQAQFKKFMHHAELVKSKYNNTNEYNTTFLIGSEIEGCDKIHIEYCKKLISENSNVIKFIIGSLHHVNNIPIDFDQENWVKAVKSSKNNIKQFLIDYYNQQYEMLVHLKPLIVGHFDLYKLLIPKDLKVNIKTGDIIDKNEQSNNENIVYLNEIDLTTTWKDVEQLIVRNLQFIHSYDGLIEINTSALRKDLKEPYPGKSICKLASEHCDNRFLLSDDAHAVSHVGVCYKKCLEFITKELALEGLYYLTEDRQTHDIRICYDKMNDIIKDPFWQRIGDK